MEPIGPTPITTTVSPGAHRRIFHALHHAGQRLGQSGIPIIQMRRNHIGIQANDARRNLDEFRISAVIEQQIFAEIHASAAAIEALQAGRGIRGHDALPDLETLDALAHRHHIAGQFVPEQSGRHDHPRVIAAQKNLDVGAAGQGRAHAHQQIVRPDVRNRNAFQLHVLFAVEHGREHRVVQVSDSCGQSENSCGRTMIFSGFSSGNSPGCVASRNANSILSSGTRCEIKQMHGSLPLKTRSADSAWISTEAL